MLPTQPLRIILLIMAPVLGLLFNSAELHAQDTLFYTNGKYIVGQVEEVGVELVRYRTMSGDASVLIVAEKRDIARIKLKNGQEFEFGSVNENAAAAPDFLARTHAISVDFLAPALDHVVVGYEQVIGRNTNLVVKAGYIGTWRGARTSSYNTRMEYSGAMFKVGVKFVLPPSQRRIAAARELHPLAGWYLRPELMLSVWSQEEVYTYYPYYGYQTLKNNYTSAAMNVVIGRQVVLGQRFTFDLSTGFGYGAQWRNGDDQNIYYDSREEYAFSHLFLGQRSPLVISGSLMFGYIF